jgi:preprotein translocase subunit SecD
MIKFNFTWKIWLLIIILAFSLLAIFGLPTSLFSKGVLITSVDSNSSAFEQGLKKGDIILKVDENEIKNIDDYINAMQGKFTGFSERTTLTTKSSEIILFSNSPPKITVSEIPKTNIKFGLDIAGGARALVKAENVSLSSSENDDLARIISNRLNVYGIDDIKVVPISDLSGENYLRIEIAGATPEDLRNLISQQGKFEAKIGNETVFVGGEKDITSVARSGQDALIESCSSQEGFYYCNFRFTIYLSESAARKHAQITRDLDVVPSPEGSYLSEKLDLYLDDNLVDSLLISEGLKGVTTTQISISGSGSGESQERAYENAREQMNKLQTILITGSFPYQLEIVKLDSLSPNIGKQFIDSIFLAGIASFLAVALIIFVRYRNIKYSIALLGIIFSEIIIILGIASLIGWNLDLPSIAGILATVGTGIDQQIIILDESNEKTQSMKQRMRRAFFIILGAYFTATASLIPLYWAAAGFFKGFAITTIIGITAGILVTRPAFGDIIAKIRKD